MGDSVGESVVMDCGEPVGDWVSMTIADVGSVVGLCVGSFVGAFVGACVGAFVGDGVTLDCGEPEGVGVPTSIIAGVGSIDATTGALFGEREIIAMDGDCVVFLLALEEEDVPDLAILPALASFVPLRDDDDDCSSSFSFSALLSHCCLEDFDLNNLFALLVPLLPGSSFADLDLGTSAVDDGCIDCDRSDGRDASSGSNNGDGCSFSLLGKSRDGFSGGNNAHDGVVNCVLIERNATIAAAGDV